MNAYSHQLQSARDAYDTNVFPGALPLLARLELGDWLTANFRWDWFTTHTFKDEKITPKQANASWFAWWNSIRLMAKAAKIPRPYYVRVAEPQKARSTPTVHYHALIGGVEPLPRLFAKDLWEVSGFARVLPYEAGRGASFYIGKYLTKGGANVDTSHNLKNRGTRMPNTPRELPGPVITL